MSKTIVVGLSGGVDSAVSALLLKQQGYNVVGLFMHNWEEKDDSGVCCSEQDFWDVKQTAVALDIPYYSVNFSKQYYDNVFSYFLQEYSLGRTPNPDVLCNREIKFGCFLQHGLALGADKIATGHYCGVSSQGGKFYLKRAKDSNKDQTYFLNQLSQQQLSYACFPLGGMTKQEVRAIADSHNLPVAKKKDSTGICFIGERRFKAFLQGFLPAKPGDIVTTDGTFVGRHQGLMYYTLGQRKGLGLGGDSRYQNGRWFVVRKNLDDNTLVVSCGDEAPLYKSSLKTGKINWIPDPPNEDTVFECLCQVRYRQPHQKCRVVLHQDQTASVSFFEPQRAITPGQYCVFYDEDNCLGGGVIESV